MKFSIKASTNRQYLLQRMPAPALCHADYYTRLLHIQSCKYCETTRLYMYIVPNNWIQPGHSRILQCCYPAWELPEDNAREVDLLQAVNISEEWNLRLQFKQDHL